MTVALGALGAAQAAKNAVPKSATLGALVLLAGGALLYWALYRSRDGRGLFGLGENAGDGGPAFLGAPGAPQADLPARSRGGSWDNQAPTYRGGEQERP